MRRIDFDATMLSRVADFECGSEPWQAEVAEWIRMPADRNDGATFWLTRGTSTWLYETDDGQLIGYGSLGVQTWTMPQPLTKEKNRVPIQIIPSFGVRTEFQHKPVGVSKDRRYASRMLSDLLAEASDRRNIHGYAPILGLLVHSSNAAAIAFYSRKEHGFQQLGQPNARNYIRMYVNVSESDEDWRLVS